MHGAGETTAESSRQGIVTADSETDRGVYRGVAEVAK
jgi:hypothetical protein